MKWLGKVVGAIVLNLAFTAALYLTGTKEWNALVLWFVVGLLAQVVVWLLSARTKKKFDAPSNNN